MLDDPSRPAEEAAARDAPEGRESRVTIYTIASATCLASMAMNFWMPLLPLYMQELGATSAASALYWTAIANVTLGACRIVSGPAWGLISDRFGRKPMFVRTLLFAAGTIAVAALAREPWHVAAAFAVQGLLSGFNPAAVALMSVSVPESRLGSSLGMATAGQFLGNTLGPAVGAGLVLVLNFRGAMFAGALLPLLAAVLVVLLVPRDQVQRRPTTPAPGAHDAAAEGHPTEDGGRPKRLLGPQFYLAIFVFFVLFAMAQVVRLLTPIVLQAIEGRADVAGATGLAFSLSGLASVLGIVLLGRRLVRPGRLRTTLVAGSLLSGLAHVALIVAGSTTAFIALFAAVSLLQAAMIPAVNTLIATSVPRARRGTGFGVASSAQAMAIMAGPLVTAGLAAYSTDLTFVVVGIVFALLGLLVALVVREPRRQAE
ncbi:MAG: MFS transporter [Dehalococcoidia bacterium]